MCLNEVEEKLILFSHFEYQLYKRRKHMFIRKLFTNVFGKRILTGETAEFVFFYSSKRHDLNDFFKIIYDSCKCDKSRIFLKKKKTINFALIIGLFKNIGFMRKINICLNKFYPTMKVTLKEKIYIYIDKVAQEDFKKSICKLDTDNIKHFIVLADALLFEQTAVEYLKTLNINTITAQHAIFFREEDFNNVQKLNYYNAPSDYALTWGIRTNKLFQEFSPKVKTIICGNPNISYKNIKKEKFVAVAGDTILFLENNKKMLNIAEQYAKKHNLKLFVRLHPSDNEKNYIIDSSVTSFEKNIENANFIICHASSMMCTYMSEGRVVFRYKDDVNLDYVSNEIEFSTVNELEQLVKNADNIKFNELSQENISYIGEESIYKYTQAFEDLKNCYNK